MSNQADVQSIDALKEFRVALALFSEDVLQALGGVDTELKRTAQWVHHDRRTYWQEQIKRRREQVTMAQSEVFRRKLQKTSDYTPAMSEQKELLRKAEAALQDAELRLGLVKKWETAIQQTLLEYHSTTARIKNLSAGDIPRAIALLERMIVSLEAYVNVSSPSSSGSREPFASIMDSALASDADADDVKTAPGDDDGGGDGARSDPGAAQVDADRPSEPPA